MTSTNATEIQALQDLVDGAARLRRDIHQHPEIAFEEERTSDLVATYLQDLGLEIHRGLAQTGVVATLEGKRPGTRRIGLRADMDALYITEENEFSHCSVHDGKMHACGHDGHTAMLLGAANYLSKNNDFGGTVHFIFQPAEEGLGGARVMIEEGLFDLFPCDAVYGLHNMPGIAEGDFGIRPGPMLAAGDTWEVTFSGTGGHGAMPHMGTDPTMALANFMQSLSTIVARNVPSSESAVISIGHIDAGVYGSPNIIPSTVLIRGTARSYTAESRDILEERLGEIAQAAAAAHRCEADYNYIRRYPALVNNVEQTEIAVRAARATVGDGKVNPDLPAIGGSEDFAFMLEKVPGAYICLGNGDGQDNHFVHTPKYDFNDGIIPYGIAYWTNIVDAELAGNR